MGRRSSRAVSLSAAVTARGESPSSTTLPGGTCAASPEVGRLAILTFPLLGLSRRWRGSFCTSTAKHPAAIYTRMEDCAVSSAAPIRRGSYRLVLSCVSGPGDHRQHEGAGLRRKYRWVDAAASPIAPDEPAAPRKDELLPLYALISIAAGLRPRLHLDAPRMPFISRGTCWAGASMQPPHGRHQRLAAMTVVTYYGCRKAKPDQKCPLGGTTVKSLTIVRRLTRPIMMPPPNGCDRSSSVG